MKLALQIRFEVLALDCYFLRITILNSILNSIIDPLIRYAYC